MIQIQENVKIVKKIYLNSGYDSHFSKCNDVRYICEICNDEFTNLTILEMHIERMHTNNNNETQNFLNIQYEEEIGEIYDENPNVENYLERYRNEIKDSMKRAINKFKFIKYSLTLNLTFSRKGQRINPLEIYIRTKFKNIFTQIDNNEIDLIIEELSTRYEEKIEEINPSDMLLDSIDYIKISYFKINPFNINSYIPLLFKTKYCVNIKNVDNQCFK